MLLTRQPFGSTSSRRPVDALAFLRASDVPRGRATVVEEDYAMAGNIFLDSTVPLETETALVSARSTGAGVFRQAVATLAAASFPGTDRRCLDAGISYRSAFLRLALPTDEIGRLTVGEYVADPSDGEDPISTLLRRVQAARAAALD